MNEQIHYRIAWRARTAFPGAHASTQSGGGLEFSHHANLIDAPDPRRLDLHASLKDPFENWLVRRFRQRSGIAVYVLADLSASMGFAGRVRKLDVIADFTRALAFSAHRGGDRFGFFGCDQRLLPEFYLPASQYAGAGMALAERLRTFAPNGQNALGLLDAASHLPRVRSLVFLLSDFHFPIETLDELLARLTAHQLVPIVLWDRAEFEQVPRWGLARLREAETKRARFVLFTPRFGAELAQAYAQRRAQLSARFAQHQTQALFMLDGLRSDQVSAYFYGTATSHDVPVRTANA